MVSGLIVEDKLTFRAPGEIALVKSKCSVFLVSTTRPHCVNSFVTRFIISTK